MRVERRKAAYGMKAFPLRQRGTEGDLARVGAVVTRKISPNPSFPKRGKS
jgi:hypothetical protein